MRTFASVRSPKLPRYLTALILLLTLHFPMNIYCGPYSVKQPTLNDRRRSLQLAPVPNYFEGIGEAGEDCGGVARSSVSYAESLPSEYNVKGSRQSGKSYEYPGHKKVQLPAAALKIMLANMAKTANLKQKIPTTPRKLLLQKLLSDYNTEELPTEILELPTVVEVNMKVLALYSVDVRNMHYYIDALLRQNWVDPRLAWNTTEELKNYTRPLMASRLKAVLWLPDLFFRNGRDGYLHKMTFPNYLLRVYPDGSVTYSQKITMRFACQMDLRTFPMDVQRCDINIGSYAYTLSDLKFVWREVMPVELPKKLQVSDYLALTTVKTLDCALLVKTSTVSYTCLRAIFTFNRQLGYYLVTFYIPSILIIVISFLSFWVNTDAATARVSLGLLSLLCLLTQASYTMTSLPRVSYTTAIDIWFMFSIIFVTCVLVEYAFAIAMLQRNEVVSGRMNVRQIVSEELVHRSVTSQQPSVGGSDESRKHSALCTEQENTMKAAATKTTKAGIAPPESEIDRCSRFIFPLCYIIYNIFYWLYYLVIVKQTENPD